MHRAIQTPLRTALLAAGLGCAALFAPATQAAGTQAQSQYQQDVARCHNTPGIDVQACLKEAGAAAQAARQDALTQPSDQAELRNRKERCDRLPADQREDCMTLMNDTNARVQGSVQSGGVLRETTITIPAPAGS
ncbi:hypothetical protein GCM10009125_06830 [Castellaniella daejeonensis]|jgi:hypothetical protein|uniref:Secreted protein n=1 Tax=Castellaniella daejeonensis TaxID=659013 RepID=A0ABP3D106_9BURK|nr:hypothetical protein [Castellaniella sp.]HET8704407.1 hypothetical protein [Castellaniella sp.]